MRYTDAELSLIKNSFAEKEDLMALFRKFLLDGEMTETETNLLKGFVSSEAVIAVLEKAIRPTLDKMAPAFQTVDLFSALDMQPTPHDHAVLQIKARHKMYEYLGQRFDILRGKKVEKLIHFDNLVNILPDKEETYVNFIARNVMLSHIDTQLFNSLMIIAGEKDETAEQQKKRLQQDSSK